MKKRIKDFGIHFLWAIIIVIAAMILPFILLFGPDVSKRRKRMGDDYENAHKPC